MDRLLAIKNEFYQNYKSFKDIDDRERTKLYLKKFTNVSTKINYINKEKTFDKKGKSYKDKITSEM